MYIFSRGLENIYSFQATNNQLVYSNNSQTKSLFLNQIEICKNISSFIFNGLDIIYCTDEIHLPQIKLFRYKIEDGFSIKLLVGFSLSETIFTNNRVRIAKWFSPYEYEESLFDYEKKSFILNKKPLPTHEINGCFFEAQGYSTLKSLSLETGEYEWEVDISQYTNQEGFSYKEAKIDSILGISGTELIVLVWSSILIIDLQTGQIKADIVGIGSKKYFPEGRSMGFTYHFHLEGEYVYLLKRERYISIHLPTQTVSILWENEDPNLNIDRVSYDENYAYFMATKAWDVQASILGVFDRKALQIVWQYEQPIYSSKPPQSDGNKLYCLDSEGILHIFERENS